MKNGLNTKAVIYYFKITYHYLSKTYFRSVSVHLWPADARERNPRCCCCCCNWEEVEGDPAQSRLPAMPWCEADLRSRSDRLRTGVDRTTRRSRLSGSMRRSKDQALDERRSVESPIFPEKEDSSMFKANCGNVNLKWIRFIILFLIHILFYIV